jgi:hypothetical protein
MIDRRRKKAFCTNDKNENVKNENDENENVVESRLRSKGVRKGLVG